jgi:hypothetical protein
MRLDLRRRLRQLIESDAFGVAVHTYHGLARVYRYRSPIAIQPIF